MPVVRRSLWHPLSDEAIFNVIRNGVPGTDMPPTKLSDDQTWNLVAFIHALTGPASTNPVPGDPAAGKSVFWGAKAGCSNCHSILGKGGSTAPDLSNVGGSRPLAVIREAIVEPAKDLYYLGNEAATVVLKNGGFNRDAAYNFEYVARVRDTLARAKGAATPRQTRAMNSPNDDLPVGPTVHGAPGIHPPGTKGEEFEIMTPMDYGEREAQPEATPGRPLPRKG